MDWPC
jgi:hypothetical protein